MSELIKGSKAPAFTLKNQEGTPVKLKDYLGKKVVIFFYPEDLTPTCTIEACNLRDNFSKLTKKGIEIIGISPDDEKKHVKFIERHALQYPLLCDPKLKAMNAYGVWAEKQMFGHKFMGVLRTTFLIDEDGKIFDIIKKVRSADHAQQILDKWKL